MCGQWVFIHVLEVSVSWLAKSKFNAINWVLCWPWFVSLTEHVGSFDIQKLKANNCSRYNTINVSLGFAEDSTAPGALVILVSIEDGGVLNFTNALYEILPNNKSDNLTSIDVPAGDCKVFAVDIEDSDSSPLKQNTTAAANQTVNNISGNSTSMLHLRDYSVHELLVDGCHILQAAFMY